MQSAEVSEGHPSESLSRYANGRRWSRERRIVVYALWLKQTVGPSDQIEGGTLPIGLRRDSNKLGVPSMASYCLSVMGSHLDRTRGEGRSWLTTSEGKVALGKRLRGPLMVHAAMDGRSGWQGFLDLFDHTPVPSRSVAITNEAPSEDKDWDETSSEEDEGPGKRAKAPAMWILDLSFVPLPSPARLRIRELLQDPLAISNLTSISFAGSGLALGDVVDMICQRESADGYENGMRKKGTLHLRLTDLNLAGIGARDETEARSALETIGDTFQELLVSLSIAFLFDNSAEMYKRFQFLDLSYTRTFPAYDGLQMLHTLYTFPERRTERLKNLEVLGFRQMISDERLEKEAVESSEVHDWGKPVIVSGWDRYVVKRTTASTVLINKRRIRAGKYLEVILQRQFETS